MSFYAFPSIAVNRFNDVLLGYSTFSTNQYAAANYSFRAFFDGNNVMRGSRVLKAGEGAYLKTFSGTRNRWGDYSATVIDPRNDADMWTIQEYATTPAPSGLTNGTGRWGTWWGQLAVPTPSNDNFFAAATISNRQGSISGTNVRGTKEQGEPDHMGQTNSVSIWFNWTAPTNGSVTFDTIGSSFDNVLAVYTGSAVGGLTLVTNDHGSAGLFSSRVVFSAISNNTYRIVVDGWQTQQGDLALNWVQPETPVFVLQPVSQWVIASNSVIFTSAAIGVPAPSYQWKLNGTSIAGATSANYTNSNVQTNDAGDYTVVATNISGSVTSAAAHLTVYNSASATLLSANYTDSELRFYVTGITSANYVVQSSTNLGTNIWVNLATNPAPFTFTNQGSTNEAYKFFRALYQP